MRPSRAACAGGQALRAPAIGPMHKLANVNTRATLCGRPASTISSIARRWPDVTCYHCIMTHHQHVEAARAKRLGAAIGRRISVAWLDEPIVKRYFWQECKTCTRRLFGPDSKPAVTHWVEFDNGLAYCLRHEEPFPKS